MQHQRTDPKDIEFWHLGYRFLFPLMFSLSRTQAVESGDRLRDFGVNAIRLRFLIVMSDFISVLET